MPRRSVCFVLALSLLTGSQALAADEAAKTFMADRGPVLLSDNFDKEIPKDWKSAKGKWEIKDGVLQGTEIKDDMHAAAIRRAVKTHNVIIEYAFKFDGAKGSSLSLNSAKGHLSRVGLAPTSISVRKDSADKNQTDKAAALDNGKVNLTPGTWHTLVVEQVASEMVASLDGKVVAVGKHEGVDQDITNIGLVVSGESAAFKNLRVYEATVKPTWAAERAKVIEAKNAK